MFDKFIKKAANTMVDEAKDNIKQEVSDRGGDLLVIGVTAAVIFGVGCGVLGGIVGGAITRNSVKVTCQVVVKTVGGV